MNEPSVAGTAIGRAWIWLLCAAALLPLANGANSVPIAAWIAPVFLLRFVRLQSPRKGLSVAWLALMAAMAFQFRGMVPIPGVGYYIFIVLFGVCLVLPYVADRLMAPRLPGFAGTLVLPSAMVAVEYLISLAPYGTWGSTAYSQYGNLALLQLVSVTGLWGITFLIAWTAAAANRVWEDGVAFRPTRVLAIACAAVVGGVLLLGGFRVAFFPSAADVVRVASLNPRDLQPALDGDTLYRQITNQATTADLTVIHNWATARDNDILLRAEHAMQAGARIVFWSESGAFVVKPDEPAFIARGGELAAKYHAYLGMGLYVWNPGHARPNENVMVLVAPDGNVAWEYAKSRPVPGFEAAMQVPGDGKLKFTDTPYGRLSAVICFDADFPQLLQQAGAARVDLLLDPSSDWRAVDPWHTQMASFRAIEQGINLVRQTHNGMSASYDYEGRQIASMDSFSSADRAMVSELPTRGATTLYARLGDWFAWICLLLLAMLGVKACRSGKTGTTIPGGS